VLFKTAEECRAYVDAELDHLVQSRPGWHARRCLDVPVRPLSWSLSHDEKDRYDSSYTLEACMDHAEFLIWFGNHQVGAEGLHWIMRPAVHVAFEDLTPRSDKVGLRYTLTDVLNFMIDSRRAPTHAMLRFDMNTFSIT